MSHRFYEGSLETAPNLRQIPVQYMPDAFISCTYCRDISSLNKWDDPEQKFLEFIPTWSSSEVNETEALVIMIVRFQYLSA